MLNIISVVSPSFNQGQFIGDTIKSILSQKGDFYIDYVIIDGASTDNSKDIIAGFEKQLKEHCEIEKLHGLEFYVAKSEFGLNRCKGISYRWMSEKDNGHAHALNKGFALTKGDIMCWLNSDDMYHENAFQTVFEVFSQFNQVKWITGLNSIWNKDGSRFEVSYLGKHNYKNIYSFLTNDYEWIQQESTFWHRNLWNKSGGKINVNYKFMVDGELWTRFFLHETVYHINKELGGYRKHDSNRAHNYMPVVKEELKRAVCILEQNVSSKVREVAKSIISNAPLQDINYIGITFKIIDKNLTINKWFIYEVDFFRYSMKRNFNKIQTFQRLLIETNQSESERIQILEKQLKEKETILQEVLSSNRYRLGKMVLKPFKFILGTSHKIAFFFSALRNAAKNLINRFSFNNALYPLGLNWSMITLPDKYIFESIKKYNVFIKRAFKEVLVSSPDIPFAVNSDAVFIKSMIRPDYNDFFQKVYQQCNTSKVLIDIEYKPGKAKHFKAALKLIWHLPIFFKIFNFRIKVSIYRYLRAISYLSSLKIMRSYTFNTLISFADMQGVENMLVQYFRKKGKRTITLQHGLYVDYSSYDNINRVNYENVVSQHFLAWGKETKQLISRFHPDTNVVICGKPIYMNINKELSDYFTLVFDQLLFTEQNIELLAISYKIANVTGYKVNVRLHPWDRKDKYIFIKESTYFSKELNDSRFVIGHTTSMVYECMRNGIPAFKYKTRFPSNVINDDLTFTNAEELIQRINNIDQYNFTELGKYYLEYVGDESLQKYTEFFNSLTNE